MIPNPPTITIPLRTDEHGVIRIGTTRVALEWVIHQYQMGETPESIVDSYSALTIADVYTVIGYYLANFDAIDAYIRERDESFEQFKREVEANRTPETIALLNRLRAIKEQQEGSK